MPKLTTIDLDDHTQLFIEVVDVETNTPQQTIRAPYVTRSSQEPDNTPAQSRGPAEKLQKQVQSMQSVMQSYTNYALDAFKQTANANIDKITLEFGVKIGGEMGIPYVTSGTADANLKVTVQCSFDD
ncbi:MAG: hypothetical protein F6J87_14165 [Spirulina sp. SIO3F2]|nr:hypothetical protein [Spirulina sp. SIO3F2]